MGSKLEPVICSRDTGHIGIHGGMDERKYVRTNGRSRHGYKTQIFCIDGLPYFLNFGAPQTCGAPLKD